MSQVFRLYTKGNNNILDWGKSIVYGDTQIKEIQDPNGATAKKEITSIPSPFARIDLAMEAFKYIKASKDLDGRTIYHKIVSDCLDIGELFFNYPNYNDPGHEKLRIIPWIKKDQLVDLQSSSNPGNKILGDTLKLFLNQDANTYHFDLMDEMYLLLYCGKNRKSQLDIIGATSPATLFFSSANDLSYLSADLSFSGNDKPFDNYYTPLYKRDPDFIKYLFALRASNSSLFTQQFECVHDYLNMTYEKLPKELKDEIDTFDKNYFNQYYDPLLFGNRNAILNGSFKLMTPKHNNNINIVSDFKIISSKPIAQPVPLVLPEKGNQYNGLTYINSSKWMEENGVNSSDKEDINERILPNSSSRKYPFLTISDFFQEKLIEVPFDINSADYFDGNNDTGLETSKGKTYLLPLKDVFFKYFSANDLIKGLNAGGKMIEMKTLSGNGVQFTLRIPVSGGTSIEYTKQYYEKDTITCKFGLGLEPFISKDGLSYVVALLSKEDGISLSFAKDSPVEAKQEIVEAEHEIRKEKTDTCSIESYLVHNSFDRIIVKCNNVQGIIVPKFKLGKSSSTFSFAIDFGTTNTHIEYTSDSNPNPKPLDITDNDRQIKKFSSDYKQAADIHFGFDEAFIPDNVGEDSLYSFPMRTALAENNGIDYKRPYYALVNGNLAFRYEKAPMPNPSYYKVRTNLKWSEGEDEVARVKLYLENILILIRNKVLLNGGDLNTTKIIWFYPVSMTEAKLNDFRLVWQTLFKEVISQNLSNLIEITESIAPFYYYKNKGETNSNLLTVDIGGGTTDIFYVESDTPKFLSSFRFAANSIFGDGYNSDVNNNGFVNTFKESIKDALDANSDKLKNLPNTFKEILQLPDSNDIIAFFFSLAGNLDVKKAHVESLNFLDMLKSNSTLKYPFIIFYGALIFYVAKLLKANGVSAPSKEKPLSIAFSGNGSKTLDVLSPNPGTIAKFFKYIFAMAYEIEEEGIKIDVKKLDEPKVATCKGGLYFSMDKLVMNENDTSNYDNVTKLNSNLLGTDDTTTLENLKYSDVKDDTIRKVAETVKTFFEEFFKINDNHDDFFTKSLGADQSILKKINEICTESIYEYVNQGFTHKCKELKDKNTTIEETMFFYPMIPILNKVARVKVTK